MQFLAKCKTIDVHLYMGFRNALNYPTVDKPNQGMNPACLVPYCLQSTTVTIGQPHFPAKRHTRAVIRGCERAPNIGLVGYGMGVKMEAGYMG